MICYVFDVYVIVYVYSLEKHHCTGRVINSRIILTQYSYYYKVVLNLITILMSLQCSNCTCNCNCVYTCTCMRHVDIDIQTYVIYIERFCLWRYPLV